MTKLKTIIIFLVFGSAISSTTLSITDEILIEGEQPYGKTIELGGYDSNYCFLTTIAGYDQDIDSDCTISIHNDYWWLQATSSRDEFKCGARCMLLSSGRSGFAEVIKVGPLTASSEQSIGVMAMNDGFCGLGSLSGKMWDDGEGCSLSSSPKWTLERKSSEETFHCSAYCLKQPTMNWDPESGNGTIGSDINFHSETAAQKNNTYISSSDGILVIQEISGRYQSNSNCSSQLIESKPSGDYFWTYFVYSATRDYFGCSFKPIIFPDDGWQIGNYSWEFIAEVQAGSLTESVQYGVRTSDYQANTNLWRKSLNAGISAGGKFWDADLSVSASSLASSKMISASSNYELTTVTYTCDYNPNLPFVRLFQWKMSISHPGYVSTTEIRADSFICQYLSLDANYTDPVCPLAYCSNLECSKCKPGWY